MLRRFFNFSLLLSLIVLTGFPAISAENKSLFWEVEKEGRKSYLFGSIHLADDSFYPLKKVVQKAFAASSVLVVEVDAGKVPLAEQQRLIAEVGLYPGQETIRDHLSKKTIAVLEKRLAEFGLPLHVVEKQRPGFISLMLTSLQATKMGYTAEKGLDRHFLNLARSKKSIRDIETFKEQLLLLAEFPDDDLIMREAFENLDREEEVWKKMEKAWKTGDAEALYQVVIEQPLKEFPEFKSIYKKLFFDRNPRMAAAVEQCISNKEVCFVVVGAGHLVGKGGVADILRKKGYSVIQK